jgi:hypothetical protein
LESGIWIIYLPAEFRIQIHKEFRGIPANFTAKNTAKFRGIPYVFKKFRIPSEVKNALPWTPYLYLYRMREVGTILAIFVTSGLEAKTTFVIIVQSAKF